MVRVHVVRSLNVSSFTNSLRNEIEDAERLGLTVDVQYAVGLQHGGAGADMLYTALVIGRNGGR